MYYIILNEQYRSRLVIINSDKSGDKDMIEHTDSSMSLRPWFQAYNIIWLFVCLIFSSIAFFKLSVQGYRKYLRDLMELGDLILIILGIVVFSLVQNSENYFTDEHWIENPGPDVK